MVAARSATWSEYLTNREVLIDQLQSGLFVPPSLNSIQNSKWSSSSSSTSTGIAPPSKVYTGLENCSSTCFLNSLLQVLGRRGLVKRELFALEVPFGDGDGDGDHFLGSGGCP